MNTGTVYVIGAGLAGLSAAVALANRGAKVRLIEGGVQAGGRCRSYFDPVLNQTIDNGNHLVLSGNHATHDYLRTIGSVDKLVGPESARFDFMDVRDGARWTIAPNEGPVPWWVLVEIAARAGKFARRICGLGEIACALAGQTHRRGDRLQRRAVGETAATACCSPC
jgi:cation diffusion facilitator CzcD-associated flavoprotein CzcO